MKVEILGRNGTRVADLNRRKAIRERCLNCSNWSRKEAAACSFIDCPLWPFRSGKGSQDAKARRKALRDYCIWCCANQKSEIGKCTGKLCPLWPFRKGSVARSAELTAATKKRHIESIFVDKNAVS